MQVNTLDKNYLDLVEDILNNGIKKSSRAGDTLSVFGRTIRHNMKDGFPILTTKKIHFKSVVSELLWFLNGETNIKFLLDRDCHIWDGDAYKNYMKGGDVKWLNKISVDTPSGKMDVPIPYSKEEFVEKIKSDPEFAKKWGDLGKIYGHGWCNWNGKSDDELYDDYLKKVKKD